MDNIKILQYIDLSKSICLEVLNYLYQNSDLSFDIDCKNPREIKSKADHKSEEIILEHLKKTNISILSEESGKVLTNKDSEYRFIIDPLDGTVNYTRGFGLSSVSIALYKGDNPIFGTLGVFPSMDIAWGGREYGAFLNDKEIKVSKISNKSEALICSGFPSRYEFDSQNMDELFSILAQYLKVRMIGSASYSILQIAMGNAEAYFEKGIMLWDVAASLAILEGAGGKFEVENLDNGVQLEVFANNGLIDRK